LMACGSARSEKIFSAVSATMFSLSATAFLVFYVAPIPPAPFGPIGCGLFLHRMMGKSHCHDKRLSPQGALR
jgi:hypothetical protein